MTRDARGFDDDYSLWFPDDGDTPYRQMKELLGVVNDGVPRGQQLTVSGDRSVLAASRRRDPFYCGQLSQLVAAEWFARVFDSLALPGRATLRQVHYVASGEEPNPATRERLTETKPDGTPYENTDEDWELLQEWSIWARNMGLVDPARFATRRGDRSIWAARAMPDEPMVYEEEEPSLVLPDDSTRYAHATRGSAAVVGYGYDGALQPTLVEVWAEKDIDLEGASVVAAVCWQEGVNLVVGTGFATISDIHAMLERRARLNRPVRILFLSDFDPAGRFIALQPARNIEFAIRRMDPRPDIRLRHLALTGDQVRELSLPRIPIKAKDLRRAGFEARHGEGAVELNAFTISPQRRAYATGMLRDAIRELRDPELRDKLDEAEERAQDAADAEHDRRLGGVHRINERLADRARGKVEEHREALEDLDRRQQELNAERGALYARIADDVAPLRDRAERVRQAGRRRMDGFADAFEAVEEGQEPTPGKVGIPALTDLGAERAGVADGWAYDSRRGYFEQLEHYRAAR